MGTKAWLRSFLKATWMTCGPWHLMLGSHCLLGMARALVAHPTCLSSMNGCIWILCFLKETPLFSFMWFFLTKKKTIKKWWALYMRNIWRLKPCLCYWIIATSYITCVVLFLPGLLGYLNRVEKLDQTWSGWTFLVILYFFSKLLSEYQC